MDVVIKRVMKNGVPALETYINGAQAHNVVKAYWSSDVNSAPLVTLTFSPSNLTFIDEVIKK